MKMMSKVIKELLRVKNIKRPFSVFQEKYKYLVFLRQSKGTETTITTLREGSKLLNVTPTFLMRIYKYDKFEEME